LVTRMADSLPNPLNGRIAVFAATSGHSGVEKVIGNLVRQWGQWGIEIDLLKIRRHGPNLDPWPEGVRLVELGASHVNTALPALIRYLRRMRPFALLTDKNRVNRAAILARILAGNRTKLGVRLGTTVSVNLASRGRFERWQQRTSIRRLYPKADRVIVPSEGVADDLSAYTGLSRDHISVVRSPIVTPELARKAAATVDHPWLDGDGPQVILGVGELGYRKDFATLIRAFALVRKERACRLLILGRGRQRDELMALANELGVTEDVDLPGFNANPYAFMARADLFVLSSRWEGMPVALVEALACHTPVVSTDCPSGPREVLEGSDVGALVPVGDEEVMADAISTWLDRHPMTESFERVISDYRIEASARAYLHALGISAELVGV
jgi:glycosyltransferase involved in cell wall biosynthesis